MLSFSAKLAGVSCAESSTSLLEIAIGTIWSLKIDKNAVATLLRTMSVMSAILAGTCCDMKLAIGKEKKKRGLCKTYRLRGGLVW